MPLLCPQIFGVGVGVGVVEDQCKINKVGKGKETRGKEKKKKVQLCKMKRDMYSM